MSRHNTNFSYRRFILDFSILTFMILFLFRKYLFIYGMPIGLDSPGAIVWLTVNLRNSWWFSVWWPTFSCGHVSIEGPTNLITPLYSGITNVFSDALITIKLFAFFSFLIAGLSIYFYVFHITNSRLGSLFSSFIYIFNQAPMAELTEGHFDIVFGYALAPIVFYFYERGLNTGKPEYIFATSIALSLLISGAWYPVTIIYGFFLVLFTFFHMKRHKAKTTLKTVLSVVILAFFISSVRVLPILFGLRPYRSGFSWPIEMAYQYSYSHLGGLGALILVPPEGIFVNWVWPILPGNLNWLLLLWLPSLVLMYLIVKRNERSIHRSFFAISIAISAFVANGPWPPFGNIFVWFYENVPYFWAFRVPGRWILMICFSYSVLAGMAITSFVTQHGNKTNCRTNKSSNKVIRMFMRIDKRLLLILVFLLIITQCWQGFFGNYLRTYNLPSSYTEPFDWLGKLQGDYRIMTTPFDVSKDVDVDGIHTRDMGYLSPAITGKSTVFFQEADFGASQDTLNFLGFIDYLIKNNRTDALMKFLGNLASVRFVVIQNYTSPSERNFILQQQGLRLLHGNPVEGHAVLENSFFRPHIYAVSDHIFLVGGRETLIPIYSITYPHSSLPTYVFSEQITDLSTKQVLLDSSKILVINGDLMDFIESYVPQGFVVRPAYYAVGYGDLDKSWALDEQVVREGKMVLSRFTLATTTRSKIDIPFKTSIKANYRVVVRLFVSKTTGSLTISVDGNPIASRSPESIAGTDSKWIDFGSTRLEDGQHMLTLSSDGSGRLDVDEVLIIPQGELDQAWSKGLQELQRYRGQVILFQKITEFASDDSSLTPLSHWNSSNGYILRFNDTTELSYNVFIPREDEYHISLRLLAEPQAQNLSIKIDKEYDFVESVSVNRTSFRWISTSSVKLSQGYHNITLMGTRGIGLDSLILHSSPGDRSTASVGDIFSSFSQIQTSYETIYPTTYEIKINATSPFILVHQESYDSLWRVLVKGEEFKPFMVNSFANGFQINKTGMLSLTLTYAGQHIVDVGWYFSSLSFFGVVILWIWRWHKNGKLKIRVLRLLMSSNP